MTGIVWTRKLTAERYPLPLSPLGWDNLKSVFDQGVRSFADFMGIPIDPQEELAKTIDGWVVANAEAFDFRKSFRIKLEPREILGLAWALVRFLVSSPSPMRELKSLADWIRHPDRSKTRLGNSPRTLPFIASSGAIRRYLGRIAEETRSSWPRVRDGFLAAVGGLDREIDAETDPECLLAIGDRLRRETILYIRPDLVIFAIKEIASMMLSQLGQLLETPCPEELPSILGSGLPRNVTLEMNRDLAGLRSVLSPGFSPEKGIEGLSAEDRGAVLAFLETYGHISPGWDIRQPTWGEDADGFCRFLRGAGEAASGNPPPGTRESDGDCWREDRKRGKACLMESARSAGADEFADFLVETLREFMQIDEDHHFFMGKVLPPTRKLVLKLGAVLKERGCIGFPEDIFWLTDSEVRSALKSPHPPDLRELAAKRGDSWMEAVKRGPPPEPSETGSQRGVRIPETGPIGLGVSRGRVTGRIHKAATPSDLENLVRGGILLVRSPDPFFTVAFPLISGLIAETGATLSHGAIAAREYGLPAVFGAKGIWDSLRNGSMVEIDGSDGTIRILGEREKKNG